VAPDLWIRGDTNGDGTVDISDAVHILAHLFRGSSPDCLRAMEVNSDGTIDLSDAVSLLSHLFVGGTPPAPPFPGCGEGESTEPCEKNFCMPTR
jgi:hypothetical protein